MRRAEAVVETRRRIVATAAREFRRSGIHTLGIADLMAKAGLTHGGFYKHFASKEALVAEACRLALKNTAGELAAAAARVPDERKLAAIVDVYLSIQHRDHPENGCAIAALSGEIVRHERQARQALAEGYDLLVGLIADALHGLPKGQRSERAMAIVATLVGAVITARAIQDETLSAKILWSARELILGRSRPD